MRNFLINMQKEAWAMDPDRLELFFAQIEGSDPTGIANLNHIEIDAGRPTLQKAGGIATIPIKGVLMKSVPKFFAWFGIEATQYKDIQAMLKEACSDDDIKSIRLHIDSPGGQVAGVSETAESIGIAAEQKPLDAYIEDMGASGAYWLAAQANSITANANAMIGSIGVYMVAADMSKMAEDMGIKIHVIRAGQLKGMGVAGAEISDEQIAAMQEVIDGIGENFITAVATGRKMEISKVRKLATGRVWLTEAAKNNGLIDSINATKVQDFKKAKGQVMSENETNTETSIDVDKINAEAAKKSRDNLADLVTAFPDDLAFAVEQFYTGATLDQAKAAYADILAGKLEASQAENEKLKAESEVTESLHWPKTHAAEAEGAETPVKSAAAGAAADGADFMVQAKQIAADKNISTTEAMKQLSETDPDLYADFRVKQKERPVKK